MLERIFQKDAQNYTRQISLVIVGETEKNVAMRLLKNAVNEIMAVPEHFRGVLFLYPQC
jgi:hypothetical protein